MQGCDVRQEYQTPGFLTNGYYPPPVETPLPGMISSGMQVPIMSASNYQQSYIPVMPSFPTYNNGGLVKSECPTAGSSDYPMMSSSQYYGYAMPNVGGPSAYGAGQGIFPSMSMCYTAPAASVNQQSKRGKEHTGEKSRQREDAERKQRLRRKVDPRVLGDWEFEMILPEMVEGLSDAEAARAKKSHLSYQKGTFIIRYRDLMSLDDPSDAARQYIWMIDNHQLLQKYIYDHMDDDGHSIYVRTQRFSGWLNDEPWLYYPLRTADLSADQKLVKIHGYPMGETLTACRERQDLRRQEWHKLWGYDCKALLTNDMDENVPEAISLMAKVEDWDDDSHHSHQLSDDNGMLLDAMEQQAALADIDMDEVEEHVV